MSVVAKTKENLNKCRCSKCPTYSLACKVKAIPEGISDMLKKDISNEKHIEMMFCAFEPSNCIKEEKGCICPTCVVYTENKLDKMYYCRSVVGK